MSTTSTTYTDGLTETVDERLAMARTEIERLTAARDILVGERPTVSTPRKAVRREVVDRPAVTEPEATVETVAETNGSPELKGNLALAYRALSESEGMRAPELGPAVGLAPESGYRLANQLRDAGLATKRKGIWRAR